MSDAGFTEIERYLFDTQGCLVIDDVLSSPEVARLLRAIPRQEDGRIVSAENDATFRGFLESDEPLFRDLIDHPRIEPILRELLTNPSEGTPWATRFWLNGAYGLTFRRGQTGPWFHNGGSPFTPWLSYIARDSRIFCGMVGLVWNLTDVAEGDGGFWYIPGSHKAAFSLPREIETYQFVPPCVVQPAVKAGSVILFTEALTHGTRTWAAEAERVALFYKYLPGYMPLTEQYPETTTRKLTDAQRRILVIAR